MAERTSIIKHKEANRLVIIREDYLNICDGDHCMAAMLGYYEYKLNAIISNLEDKAFDDPKFKPNADDYFIQCSPKYLSKSLMGLFGRTKIISANERLLEKNLISIKIEKVGFGDNTRFLPSKICLNVQEVNLMIEGLSKNEQGVIQNETTPYPILNNPLSKNEQGGYPKTDRSSNNTSNIKESIIENSPYGDGRLHFLCVEYAKANPDKYPKEFYIEFLQYWTAPIQKGTKIGKELWKDEKAFQLASRFNTSWNTVWKNRKPTVTQSTSQYGILDPSKIYD